MRFSGSKLPAFYLKPGEAHFSQEPSLVMILIGSCISVGKENIEAAGQMILKEGLKVLVSHTGGTFARRILFFTHTGEVFTKRAARITPAEATI